MAEILKLSPRTRIEHTAIVSQRPLEELRAMALLQGSLTEVTQSVDQIGAMVQQASHLLDALVLATSNLDEFDQLRFTEQLQAIRASISSASGDLKLKGERLKALRSRFEPI